MKDRKQEQIDELISRVERLTLEHTELTERNHNLEQNQQELRTDNRHLRARVRNLEVRRQATGTRQIIWPRVGDRVRLHNPTLPVRYHRQFFIAEDRIGTVYRVDHRWVFINTDSGIERYREPQSLDIIGRANDVSE